MHQEVFPSAGIPPYRGCNWSPVRPLVPCWLSIGTYLTCGAKQFPCAGTCPHFLDGSAEVARLTIGRENGVPKNVGHASLSRIQPSELGNQHVRDDQYCQDKASNHYPEIESLLRSTSCLLTDAEVPPLNSTIIIGYGDLPTSDRLLRCIEA